MTNAMLIAGKLLEAGAVKLNLHEPFTWASGWRSPIYCDNRTLLSAPEIRTFIKSELVNNVKAKFGSAEVIAGVATAGIPWGVLVAEQMNLPFIYVRPKPKEHGLGNQIEGALNAGAKVIVVEDLLSTGKSSLQVVEVLRGAGAEVIGISAIFSYSFPVAANAFGVGKVDFSSLTTYPDLLKMAMTEHKFTGEEYQVLLNWNQNPSTWTGKN